MENALYFVFLSRIEKACFTTHNPKVVSSNLAPATIQKACNFGILLRLRAFLFLSKNCVEGTIRALRTPKRATKANKTASGEMPGAVFYIIRLLAV
mgnify:CR=1 FL=1